MSHFVKCLLPQLLSPRVSFLPPTLASQVGRRFISSPTSPQSLPLSPWYYVIALVAGRPLGEQRESGWGTETERTCHVIAWFENG